MTQDKRSDPAGCVIGVLVLCSAVSVLSLVIVACWVAIRWMLT